MEDDRDWQVAELKRRAGVFVAWFHKQGLECCSDGCDLPAEDINGDGLHHCASHAKSGDIQVSMGGKA